MTATLQAAGLVRVPAHPQAAEHNDEEYLGGVVGEHFIPGCVPVRVRVVVTAWDASCEIVIAGAGPLAGQAATVRKQLHDRSCPASLSARRLAPASPEQARALARALEIAADYAGILDGAVRD